MRLTEEEYQQHEQSAALVLSAGPQVSISNLSHISLGAFPVPIPIPPTIPPTITIDRDYSHRTSCTLSPLRGRLVSGMTILCTDGGVKTTLLVCTLCTIPACRADLYKNPEFSLAGEQEQMGWKMESLGNGAVGFSIHFTMGVPPRVVAVVLSDFPAKVEERAGVCTWRAR